MTAPTSSAVLGRWRITEIEGWDADYVDMIERGYVQLNRDGGSIAFGAVQLGLDCWYSPTGVHFSFHGSDEAPRSSATAMPTSNPTAPSSVKSAFTTATTCRSPLDGGEFRSLLKRPLDAHGSSRGVAVDQFDPDVIGSEDKGRH